MTSVTGLCLGCRCGESLNTWNSTFRMEKRDDWNSAHGMEKSNKRTVYGTWENCISAVVDFIFTDYCRFLSWSGYITYISGTYWHRDAVGYGLVTPVILIHFSPIYTPYIWRNTLSLPKHTSILKTERNIIYGIMTNQSQRKDSCLYRVLS